MDTLPEITLNDPDLERFRQNFRDARFQEVIRAFALEADIAGWETENIEGLAPANADEARQNLAVHRQGLANALSRIAYWDKRLEGLPKPVKAEPAKLVAREASKS